MSLWNTYNYSVEYKWKILIILILDIQKLKSVDGSIILSNFGTSKLVYFSPIASMKTKIDTDMFSLQQNYFWSCFSRWAKLIWIFCCRFPFACINDYGHRNMQLLNVIILCTKCKCSAPVFSLREGLVKKVLDLLVCWLLYIK